MEVKSFICLFKTKISSEPLDKKRIFSYNYFSIIIQAQILKGGIFISGLLEALMVVSFGISWPLSIYKSYKSRTTKGKSLLFLFFILFGYACGIASKLVSGNITYVFIFYVLNFILVAIDLLLYFRNSHLQSAEK